MLYQDDDGARGFVGYYDKFHSFGAPNTLAKRKGNDDDNDDDETCNSLIYNYDTYM